jgi:type IV secretory pathway VirJ component
MVTQNKKSQTMKIKIFLSIIFLVLQTQIKAVTESDSLKVPSFGKVYIFNRTKTPEVVIIMISGESDWKSKSQNFSENSLVVGVDLKQYYKTLKERTDDCYNVAADFVELATEVEKKYDFPDYKPPVLMGYSGGGMIVFGILAQARPGTFIGGISIGFNPRFELPKMLCQNNGLSESVDIPGKRYLFQPGEKLGNPWVVIQNQVDKANNYAVVSDFVSKTKNAELVTIPKEVKGSTKRNDLMTEWKDAYSRLLTKYEKDKPPIVNIDEVKNIPVVITNSKIEDQKAPIALVVSGDGGWYSFEQLISDNMAKQGIPTIGLDSKKYFWKRRTPEETASDMDKVLNFYGKLWGRDKFVLIGYSLGAEIVPFIVNRLPEKTKSRIESVVLLSPATTTDFEIHISNMLGMGNRQNVYHPIDEIIKMQAIQTLIIFGDGEKTQVPELLNGTSVTIKKIPGDHHYKFNLQLIMQTMRENKAF